MTPLSPTARTLDYPLSSPIERARVASTGAFRASLISSKLANKSLHRERRREGALGEAS